MQYEIKPKEKLNLGLGEMWQYRELFYFFTWRDIKVKYKQTVLGFLWAILQPLVMTALLSFSLGSIITSSSKLTIPYPLFVMSGLVIWNIFSAGLANAGNSMVTNANIIKKIYFPRLIIPISAVIVSLFDFLMAFLVFIGMLFYYRDQFSLNLLLFIPVLLLSVVITSITTFGMGSLLAALNIKYRDFRYIIPFMIQALMFVTPVIYPVSLISKPVLKYLVACNPMYGAVELFRYSIIQGPVDMMLLAISFSSALLFFITGLYYFRKTEAYFADLA
jgi:lipopolysaccharide transport system permease protein